MTVSAMSRLKSRNAACRSSGLAVVELGGLTRERDRSAARRLGDELLPVAQHDRYLNFWVRFRV